MTKKYSIAGTVVLVVLLTLSLTPFIIESAIIEFKIKTTDHNILLLSTGHALSISFVSFESFKNIQESFKQFSELVLKVLQSGEMKAIIYYMIGTITGFLFIFLLLVATITFIFKIIFAFIRTKFSGAILMILGMSMFIAIYVFKSTNLTSLSVDNLNKIIRALHYLSFIAPLTLLTGLILTKFAKH